MKMKKPPSEANPGKDGWENNAGALATQKIREATPYGRSEAQSKPRADGQDPHRAGAETASHSRLPVGRAKPGNQPRTRRRHLLALGVNPGKVHMATRSRKGYWRMSKNELVQIALTA